MGGFYRLCLSSHNITRHTTERSCQGNRGKTGLIHLKDRFAARATTFIFVSIYSGHSLSSLASSYSSLARIVSVVLHLPSNNASCATLFILVLCFALFLIFWYFIDIMVPDYTGFRTNRVLHLCKGQVEKGAGIRPQSPAETCIQI